jgi:hypothetical protein
VRLRDGKLFAGDGSAPEQWFGFGAEVYAVADGTVVAVEEGRPEEVPAQPVANVHQPRDYGGNFVTLEIAPGVSPSTPICSRAASRSTWATA